MSTLLEKAKEIINTGDEELAYYITEVARSYDILQHIHFIKISGRSVIFNREQELPKEGFKSLNDKYEKECKKDGEKVERVTETLAYVGGNIDVDLIFTKANKEKADIKRAKEIKKLANNLAYNIINGDTEKDPAVFDGIKVRCLEKKKVISNNDNGAPLIIDRLDELIDMVENPTHLLMNEKIQKQLDHYYRKINGVGLEHKQDAFGKEILYYSNLPILSQPSLDDNKQIIPFDEVSLFGNKKCTSVYCVSFTKLGFSAMESKNIPINIKDVGEWADDEPVYRKILEWYVGTIQIKENSIARLVYVTDGKIKE